MVEKVDAVIKVKRGLEQDRVNAFLSAGELAYSTDIKRLFVGDDSYGGQPGSTRVHFNNISTNRALSGDLYVDNTTGITSLYVLTGNDYTRLDNYVFLANNNADAVYTLVQENSTFWGIAGGQTGALAYTTLVAHSGNWESTYSVVSASSAAWSTTYTIVSANSAVWTRKYSELFGDGVNNTFVITHNLNSQDIVANVVDSASREVVYPGIQYSDPNSLIITFNTAPALTAYKVVVVA